MPQSNTRAPSTPVAAHPLGSCVVAAHGGRALPCLCPLVPTARSSPASRGHPAVPPAPSGGCWDVLPGHLQGVDLLSLPTNSGVPVSPWQREVAWDAHAVSGRAGRPRASYSQEPPGDSGLCRVLPDATGSRARDAGTGENVMTSCQAPTPATGGWEMPISLSPRWLLPAKSLRANTCSATWLRGKGLPAEPGLGSRPRTASLSGRAGTRQWPALLGSKPSHSRCWCRSAEPRDRREHGVGWGLPPGEPGRSGVLPDGAVVSFGGWTPSSASAHCHPPHG